MSATRHRCRTYGDHLGGDVADTAGPVRRGLVQDIVNPETAVLLGQRIKVFLEEDILGSDVGEDQVNLGLVTGSAAADDGANDLEHGGDPGAAGNHAKVTDHVGSIDECALGALDTKSLPNLEGRHMLRDVAGGVGFDEQVEITRLVVTRDGSVGSHNLLGSAIRLGQFSANGNVLADGQSEDGVGSRKSETVAVNSQSAGVPSDRPAVRRERNLRGATYMATLWEMTVFSLSSNSWNASGFRIFLTSVRIRPMVSLRRGRDRGLQKTHGG